MKESESSDSPVLLISCSGFLGYFHSKYFIDQMENQIDLFKHLLVYLLSKFV